MDTKGGIFLCKSMNRKDSIDSVISSNCEIKFSGGKNIGRLLTPFWLIPGWAAFAFRLLILAVFKGRSNQKYIQVEVTRLDVRKINTCSLIAHFLVRISISEKSFPTNICTIFVQQDVSALNLTTIHTLEKILRNVFFFSVIVVR